MKKIPYVVKKVSNIGTIYHQIGTDNRTWILNQADAISNMDDACRASGDATLISVSNTLNAPNKTMPRKSAAGGGGYNSVRSMCDGVTKNFNNGQFDLSHKTMPGVQEAFRVASELFESFEDVEFEEVASLPKTKSVAKFEVSLDGPETTFSELFEFVMIQAPVFQLRKKAK